MDLEPTAEGASLMLAIFVAIGASLMLAAALILAARGAL